MRGSRAGHNGGGGDGQDDEAADFAARYARTTDLLDARLPDPPPVPRATPARPPRPADAERLRATIAELSRDLLADRDRGDGA